MYKFINPISASLCTYKQTLVKETNLIFHGIIVPNLFSARSRAKKRKKP